jgi:phosphate uptake regulator
MPILRKIQLTGSSTLSVSLPSDWTKRYGVKRGTQVYLNESGDGSLIVQPTSSKHGPVERLVDLGRYTQAQHVRRAFLAAYLSGADVVRFHSAGRISALKRKVIVEQAHQLIGVEVTEETPNLIVVQDFFSHEGLSVTKTLRRAHGLTCSMFEQLVEGIRDSDAASSLEILDKDDDVDRLRFLLRRQLNLALENTALMNELGLTAPQCLNYAIVARNIESTADKLSVMAKYNAELAQAGARGELVARLARTCSNAYEVYQQAVKSFMMRDSNLANNTIEEQAKLIQSRVDFEKLLSGQKARTGAYQYSVILDGVLDIGECAREISEATIDSDHWPADKKGAQGV